MNYQIILTSILSFIIGIAVYFLLVRIHVVKGVKHAEKIIIDAENKANSIIKEAVIDGKTRVHDLKIDAEKYIKEKKNDILESEKRILKKENSLDIREQHLVNKEKILDSKIENLNERLAVIEKKEHKLEENINIHTQELERIANLSMSQAKEELMAVAKKNIDRDIAIYLKDSEEEAREKANETARNIIALTIQGMAHDEVIDRCVTVVNLPSEEMKGRIIGREGRNIKAIEKATGVDIIIDDTPEVIVLSCFNPIRREIAKIAMEALISDGRIQPGRIEEMVEKAQQKMEEHILKVGEETIFNLRIPKMDKELVKLIGKLKYRFSYGQSVLQHSIETATFCGIMAAELGLNQAMAKRAGLLHDIGKALDFETDGTHVELGYKAAKKAGEHEIVLNAIQAHHGDVDCKSIIAHLVIAADALSAARPGARSESIENYISRLTALEEISMSYNGVKKAFAISAGREIRVMVEPEEVDDLMAKKIARDIKERIENELTYPGNVKVNVIRELRAIEIAK